MCDLTKINQIFSPRDRKEIVCILPSLTLGADKIIWHWAPNGCYSVKLRYRVITKRIDSNSHLFIEGEWAPIYRIYLIKFLTLFGERRETSFPHWSTSRRVGFKPLVYVYFVIITRRIGGICSWIARLRERFGERRDYGSSWIIKLRGLTPLENSYSPSSRTIQLL